MFYSDFRRMAGAAIIAGSLGVSGAAHATPITQVDLELSLLVDVSGSVNDTEFALQRDGYVNAFKSAAVQNAILGGNLGKIAVNFIYWSGFAQQRQEVQWTLIDSATSATAFADAIAAVLRPFSGLTAIQSAIAFADPLFDTNMFDAVRKVMDVSGDGTDNDSPSGLTANTTFCSQSTTTTTPPSSYAINGVVIGGEDAVLNHYKNNVQCGLNSFTSTAADFADFGSAIQQKLIREITPSQIPLPAAGWLLIAGLGGLAALRRRKAA